MKPVAIMIGPSPETLGGMASVIQELTATKHARWEFEHLATWWPANPIRSTLAGLTAPFRILATRRRPTTVVHVHLSERGSFLREGYVLVAMNALGYRTAATLHGASFPDFAAKHPALTRFILNRARIIFTLGPRTASDVRAVGVRSQLATVLNPVSDLFAPQEPPLTNRGAPTVLFAGEVGVRKGFDVLRDAWPLVLAEKPDAQLLVCGPEHNSLTQDDRIGMKYLGEVPRTGLPALYQAADITCLPSRQEVLPMTILESLSCGTPVVCSAAGELPSLTNVPGVTIVAEPDPQRLAAALVSALERIDLQDPRTIAHWAKTNAASVAVQEVLISEYEASKAAE